MLGQGACACMGPQGNDPVCPCRMRNMGLKPTSFWTPEKEKEFDEVLSKIFGFNKEDGKKSECMHQNCNVCGGTGRNKVGAICAHAISCPCKKCSPVSM